MKKLNQIHKIVWYVLAVGIAVAALIYNPAHLFTAAMCFVVGRYGEIEWDSPTERSDA